MYQEHHCSPSGTLERPQYFTVLKREPSREKIGGGREVRSLSRLFLGSSRALRGLFMGVLKIMVTFASSPVPICPVP